MGDFAYRRSSGERVKIGTRGALTDLRFDQRDQIMHSEIDVYDLTTLQTVWFRFPWPDEDAKEPGDCDNCDRKMGLSCFVQPPITHGAKQFSAHGGYLVMLPCPEDTSIERDYKIMHNGYSGPAELIGQAWRGGRLVGVARCNGCDHIYMLDERYAETAATIISARGERDLLEAQRHNNEGGGHWYFTVADRLLAGYRLTSYR